jgi:hypothetical protein
MTSFSEDATTRSADIPSEATELCSVFSNRIERVLLRGLRDSVGLVATACKVFEIDIRREERDQTRLARYAATDTSMNRPDPWPSSRLAHSTRCVRQREPVLGQVRAHTSFTCLDTIQPRVYVHSQREGKGIMSSVIFIEQVLGYANNRIWPQRSLLAC